MTLWEIKGDQLAKVSETTFAGERIQERSDLQRLLRDHVEAVAPGTMVIAEEYSEWTDSRRRLDLLAVDESASLVVIELKTTEDGGHMELQAIRYAAMVSTMTFAKAVSAFRDYLHGLGSTEDAEALLLEHLGWEEPNEEEFANEVRIVLASAEFSKEITTAVLWLNDSGLDITCVRMRPYKLDERLLLDIQQVIPLPEAASYQVQVREKAEEKRQARRSNADFTRYDLTVGGKSYTNLWKRRIMLHVIQAAIEAGRSPDELAKRLPGTPFVRVSGNCSSDEFVAKLADLKTPRGHEYDPRRFFLADDELFHVNGDTLAFTNQWGGRWRKALKSLREAYPELEIDVSGPDI